MLKDRTNLMIAVALALVTVAVYARAAFFPFHLLDDPYVVVGNPNLSFSADSLKWAFTTSFTGNWQPLTWLSLMFDHLLFSKVATGYHVVNVLWHVLNTVSLYFLFRYLTGAVWRSAAVAALFALHPLHVESVAWITERKDVLSGFFFILTLFLYAACRKEGSNRYYYGALACFVLGLMAKPMLVTVPVVLLILDFWPLQRFQGVSRATFGETLVRVLVEKVPFLVLSLVVSVVTVFAQKSEQAISSLETFSLGERLSNSLLSYLRYVAEMILPINLSVFYPMRPVAVWEAAGAALVIAAALFLAVKTARKFPYIAAGLFWYLVTLLPVVGLVQVGSQSMADRYTYLPLIGVFVVFCWGAADLAARFPQSGKVITAAGAAAIAAYALVTWVQLSYWKDNVNLFLRAVEVTRGNFLAHLNLGIAYSMEGRDDLAVVQYKKYLEIMGDDHAVHNSVGKALDRLGRSDEAALEYQKALELKPDEPEYLNNVGTALLQQNRVDDAIKLFSEALRLNPEFAQAASNLQFAQSRKSRPAR